MPELDLSGEYTTSIPKSIGYLTDLKKLDLSYSKIKTLPKNIGDLRNLTHLHLEGTQLTKLPESIGNLKNLTHLYLDETWLSSLPDSIGKLTNLTHLHLYTSVLASLPDSICNLKNLTSLILSANTWLLDEENSAIRQVLIQQIGYDRICQELDAIDLDNWREYTLLKIDAYIEDEPMVLLKMTCPSTGHIHILLVPPEMTSAEAAITWVNYGIHPDAFAVQT